VDSSNQVLEAVSLVRALQVDSLAKVKTPEAVSVFRCQKEKEKEVNSLAPAQEVASLAKVKTTEAVSFFRCQKEKEKEKEVNSLAPAQEVASLAIKAVVWDFLSTDHGNCPAAASAASVGSFADVRVAVGAQAAMSRF